MNRSLDTPKGVTPVLVTGAHRATSKNLAKVAHRAVRRVILPISAPLLDDKWVPATSAGMTPSDDARQRERSQPNSGD